MRLLLALCVITCVALPTSGAKVLTVDQLQKLLDNAHRSHRTESDLVREIGDRELSERLTSTTLEQLVKPFQEHPKVGLALQLLADRSAFLAPPANEMPKLPPLSAQDQRKQLEAAREFVGKTLPNLPNFLASKTTFNFDDSPQVLPKGGWAERDGLHLVGQSKAEVSVRNENENASTASNPIQTQASGGLISWGEFGSTLFIVLGDAATGTIGWDHWERGATGPVSVFHYDVPKSASHYELVMPTRLTRSSGTDRWIGSAGVLQNSTTTVMVHSKHGYHGSLWVDPASGTVLGVSVIADLKGDSTFQRGAILVEYGSVQIGSRTFICPTRSLALSAAAATVKSTLEGQTTLWLNENLFSNYHLFASTSRILNENAADSELTVPGGSEPRDAGSAATNPTLVQPVPASSPDTKAEKAQASSPPPPAQTTPDAGLNRKKNQRPESPSSGSDAQSAPSESGALVTPAVPQGPITDPTPLKVDVNAVLVPVVVRGRDGHFIDGLHKEDFAVLDDGKPRQITGFTV